MLPCFFPCFYHCRAGDTVVPDSSPALWIQFHVFGGQVRQADQLGSELGPWGHSGIGMEEKERHALGWVTQVLWMLPLIMVIHLAVTTWPKGQASHWYCRSLRTLEPSGHIMWSDIIPKSMWRYACDPRRIDQARKGVNREVGWVIMLDLGSIVKLSQLKVA